MADVDRIIARLRRHPPEVDFRDLRQVLEAHGWRMGSQSGSHVVFRQPGRLPMSIPLIGGRRVKRAYVRQVLKAIDEES
jgi:predicted RNA binding protein YcfA (HicA-like mRNA interferase family)